MCFHSQQTKKAVELENRFNAKFENNTSYSPGIYNGFQHPKTPVITNKENTKIQLFQWGLIPSWAKDTEIQKLTLNARMETVLEKPAFKYAINKRCLILADGYFEWQWLDSKGKNKKKFLVSLPKNETFAFAGLWSEWINPTSNEIINSYTILTTEANELLSKIHNTKKRMPLVLSKEAEFSWLNGKDLMLQNDKLIAIEIDKPNELQFPQSK